MLKHAVNNFEQKRKTTKEGIFRISGVQTFFFGVFSKTCDICSVQSTKAKRRSLDAIFRISVNQILVLIY